MSKLFNRIERMGNWLFDEVFKIGHLPDECEHEWVKKEAWVMPYVVETYKMCKKCGIVK